MVFQNTIAPFQHKCNRKPYWCIWYSPTCDSTDFDDNIFNEYEKANLEILSDLDTY